MASQSTRRQMRHGLAAAARRRSYKIVPAATRTTRLRSVVVRTVLCLLPLSLLATSTPQPSSAPTSRPPIVNPNTTQSLVTPPETPQLLDVKKLASATRPAVALVSVSDNSGKLVKTGTGFFVSKDGKLITNSHVIEGAATATAKLENGATYAIRGVLKAAPDKDLVILQADAKDVPFLSISKQPMAEVGSRVAVIGSPLGLEGTVSEGIISGQRALEKDDQWLQMTAPVSPGSSGSPVVDQDGKVVGVATFIVDKAQALNFARPVEYVAQLIDESAAATEPAPLWTIASNPKNVVLNDPDFLAAERALEKDDTADALKLLNGIAPKYPENALLLFKFGAVYGKLNLMEDAVQAYQHALKLQPTSGMGWTNLGIALTKLNRFGDAKEAAKQAVKLAPDYGQAWGLLGLSYAQENHFADAVDAFQKAARLTPNDAEVWRSLSINYARLNDAAKSQEAQAKWRSLTASETQARTAEEPRERYTELVVKTLQAFEENDVERLLSRYANKVVYRDYGIVDRNFIRQDLEKYFTRWPVTKTRLKGAVQVQSTSKPDEKRVLFRYEFRATAPARGASSIGSAANEWWVWETNGQLKLFGEKQKVTRHPGIQ